MATESAPEVFGRLRGALGGAPRSPPEVDSRAVERGAIVGGRFEVESVAGAGGMGTVYRAIDTARGCPVAVKILHEGGEIQRFEREAQILRQLDHPSIVRYVGHGEDERGVPFLAMEWLEGESLSQRLKRAGLTVAEAVDLARRVASALAGPHAAGIVHRDLKPSNVFLVGGDVATPKVLDFGVARAPGDRKLTMSGTALGTPGYMAPEQARGETPIRPSADVFSLGCILFRCITGRAPFEGDEMIEVLLKLVLEDPPRLRALRDDVSVELDDVVHRMLAKPPSDRPANAAALALVLEGLGALEGGAPGGSASTRHLTATEQRVVSVVVARPRESQLELDRSVAATASASRTPEPGAVLHVLLDGSQVLAFHGDDTPADRAVRAADAARRFRAELDGARVVVATGRGIVAKDRASGDVLARASTLLRGARSDEVVVDEMTARLLERRFDAPTLARAGGFAALSPEPRRRAGAQRRVLGHEVPCVGRNAELAALAAVAAQSVDESRPSVASIVAPAGLGKTRVVSEAVERFVAREVFALTWTATAEPVSAGSPYALIASMIARAADVHGGEALADRHDKLVRLAAAVPDDARPRVVHFLAELVGAPFPPGTSVELDAAREDPILLGDHLLRAVVDLVAATTATRPLLVTLDDAQWGDVPSFRIVEHLIKSLADRPIIVFVAGRPEIEGMLHPLLAEEGSLELRLAPLARKASEALVSAALGPDAPEELVVRLALRAQGHPHLLEELVRAHAADPDAVELPEGVLALVETRLERLPRESRRVLRAASVFGRVFWGGGVQSLLGESSEPPTSSSDLDGLRDREIVVASASTRFAGEIEYAFASALLRDAVYATLTEADRVVGHRLAAAWLERAGELDARLLAGHLERCGDVDAAAVRYREAAIDALAGNAFADAIDFAKRARACLSRPDAATLAPGLVARLWTVEAEASLYSLGAHAAEEAARTALAIAIPGSAVGFDATAAAVIAVARSGGEGLDELAAPLETIEPEPDARRAAAMCLARTVIALAHVGRFERAEALYARCSELAQKYWQDPLVSGRVAMARARVARARGDVPGYAAATDEAVAAIDRTGDRRTASNWRVALGSAQIDQGALDVGEAALLRALHDAEAVGCYDIAGYALNNLGILSEWAGHFDTAMAQHRRSLEFAIRARTQGLEGIARSAVARNAIRAGRLDEARAELACARPIVGPFPDARVDFAVSEVLLALAEGRVAHAAEVALAARVSCAEQSNERARLAIACVDALDAAGRADEAIDVLLTERESVLARAALIVDPVARRGFLERIPAHARLLELGARALAEGDGG